MVTVVASILIGAAAPAALAILFATPSPPSSPASARTAPATRGTTGSAVVTHELGVRQQDAATRYWTPDRMRAALRNAWVDGNTMGNGLRWVHAGNVGETTGKVFFTLNGTDYVCSGSVVSGPGGQDVVLTAAHCVGRAAAWATNWTFVPGYTNGTRPYGAYTARRFFVSRRWADPADGSAVPERYDVAFVTVNPSDGRSLGAVTGGQHAAFGTKASGLAESGADIYVFGYPSEPPFSGRYPNYCAGAIQATAQDGTAFLRCGMTAGDSGGPWFARFSPRTGTGTIVAVTTYKFSGKSSPLYGTLLGRDARDLYNEAVRSAATAHAVTAHAVVAHAVVAHAARHR